MVSQTGQAQAYIGYEYYTAVMSSNPIIYYRLNETSGTSALDSIHHQNGTYSGTITFSRGHKINLDNNDSVLITAGYVQATYSGIPTSTSAKITVEFWIKTSTTEKMFFGFNVYDLYLRSSDSHLGFNTGAGDNGGFDYTSYLGKWTHIVAVFSGTAVGGSNNKIYVNGVSQTLSPTPNATSIQTTFKFGGWNNDNNFNFTADVDDFSMYDYELDATTIAAHYQAGLPRAYGQAQAQILGPFTGQATALIDSSIKQQWAQSNAKISPGYGAGFAQAQALLNTRFRWGQAQAKLIVAQNAYENVIFSQVPLGYWPLDEASGSTFSNRTGNGDSTLSGTMSAYSVNHPLADIAGNTGVTFNTTSSITSATMTGIPTATGSAVTVTGWIKLASANDQLFFGFFVYDILFTSSTKKLGFNTGVTDNYGFDATSYVGVWVHIAAVFYDNQAPSTANKIYINGVSQTLSATGSPVSRDLDTPFHISGWGAGTSDWAKGTTMDAIAIFPRELTSTEIQAQYNIGIPKGYGQAQAQITGFSAAYGQAQADVKATNNGFGQSNSDIKATNNGFGQSQADIKQTYFGSGQSQADVKQTYYGLGQSNADILAQNYGLGQSNADIKSTNSAFGQSQGDILQTYDGFGQSQADIKQIYNGFGQANADILAQGYGFGQASADCLGQSYGFGQAQADLGGENFGWGQSNADIKATLNAFGQSQSDIKQTYSQFGQAQTDIKAAGNGFGQAQATVTGNAFGQAQGDILTQGYGSGQSQTDIKQTYVSCAQAQADIKYTAWGLGQSNCDIKAVGNGFGQANADITIINNAFGQARARISGGAETILLDTFSRTFTGDLGTPDIGPDWNVDDNSLTETDFVSADGSTLILSGSNYFDFWEQINSVVVPDATFTIDFYLDDVREFATLIDVVLKMTSTTDFTNSVELYAYYDPTRSSISLNLGQHNSTFAEELIDPPVATTWYTVKFYTVGSDIKAKIWQRDQTEPDWQITQTVGVEPSPGSIFIYTDLGGSGSLPATTLYDNINITTIPASPTKSKIGQAQAEIHRFEGYGQAQAAIDHAGHGQANADIKAKISRCAQAMAWIKSHPTKSAQSQAFIRKWAGYGQAWAYILQNEWQFGSAQAVITLSSQAGQAKADIKVTQRGFGQAQAFNAYRRIQNAQANAIIYIRYYQSAQATCLITASTKVASGNAQGFITGASGWNSAQARARIQKYPLQFGQAWAYIVNYTFGMGNAGALITRKQGCGQAQSYILKPQQFAQGQGMIRVFANNGSAQAQAFINRHQGYGQAMATINLGAFAQAQAYVVVKSVVRTGNAQAFIVKTRQFGQSQARINIVTVGLAQAQSYILNNKIGYAQAQAQIKRVPSGYGQALATIINRRMVGQAQGYINSPVFVVKYNGYQLPGYVQTASYESVMDIFNTNPTYFDMNFAEYSGLKNKILSLKVKTWTNNDFNSSKEDTKRASTIVRSSRGFARLYVQYTDKHYDAIVQTFNTENAVETSVRTYDYDVTFETKPWLISDVTTTISGTGLIDTGSRTLANGTWSPTRVRLTGTDITVSGYTATGEFTGYINVSGAVSDLIINAEAYSATIAGVNRNDVMRNYDYALYVGPGKTYFDISGATDCVIEWEDRF